MDLPRFIDGCTFALLAQFEIEADIALVLVHITKKVPIQDIVLVTVVTTEAKIPDFHSGRKSAHLSMHQFDLLTSAWCNNALNTQSIQRDCLSFLHNKTV